MGESTDIARSLQKDPTYPSEAVLRSPNLHYYIRLRELVCSYLSPEDVAAVDKAFVLADQAHSKQRRASGEPYIIHPIAVATIVAKMHLDTESVQAAQKGRMFCLTSIGRERDRSERSRLMPEASL